MNQIGKAREAYIKARGTDGRTEGGATDSDAHSAPIRRTDVISGRWRDCTEMELWKGTRKRGDVQLDEVGGDRA